MAGDDDDTRGAHGVQVFELTMDNPEDQDELNCRLKKAGDAQPIEQRETPPSEAG